MDLLHGCFSEKRFIRSSFNDIACFSILASEPHVDATISLRKIFRSSSIGAVIFKCGLLIINASLVVEVFFGRSRILSIM